MSLRKTVSLTALLSFVLLVTSSIILFVEPAGRVAYWSGWRLWMLSKEQWGALHTNLGVLLLVAIVLHTWLNWPALVGYLRSRNRKLRILTADFNLALLLLLLVCAGTLFGVPPFSSITGLGTALSEQANLHYGEPPYGHAELSPLAVFAERVKLDPDQSLARLRHAGFQVEGPEQTLEQIARRNGVTPRTLYETMNPVAGSNSGTLPAEPPGGTGNRSLEQICASYRLDLQAMRSGLAARGLALAPEQSFREIARANGRDPHQVYTLLYEIAAEREE